MNIADTSKQFNIYYCCNNENMMKRYYIFNKYLLKNAVSM